MTIYSRSGASNAAQQIVQKSFENLDETVSVRLDAAHLTAMTNLSKTSKSLSATAPKAPKKSRKSGFTHEAPVGKSDEWYTPKEIFDDLGVRFDLDPCSPGVGKSFVPADRVLTAEDDGLATPWGADDFVWMNPPYSRSLITPFMKKMSEHGNGIALVFARTDVKWFHEHVAAKADLVCFVDGRIQFYEGSIDNRGGSPGTGSMLVAYGKEAADVVARSGLGACVTFNREAVAARSH